MHRLKCEYDSWKYMYKIFKRLDFIFWKVWKRFEKCAFAFCKSVSKIHEFSLYDSSDLMIETKIMQSPKLWLSVFEWLKYSLSIFPLQ